MYNGNIFKSHMVVVQDDDTLLIDNNERIAKKIESLEEAMINSARSELGEDSFDGFVGGLDAEMVEALTADSDEELPTVIKAERPEEVQETQTSADALAIVSAQAQEVLEAARREAENLKSQAMIEVQQELEAMKNRLMRKERPRVMMTATAKRWHRWRNRRTSWRRNVRDWKRSTRT